MEQHLDMARIFEICGEMANHLPRRKSEEI